MSHAQKCFIPFNTEIEPSLIPAQLNDPFSTEVPEICKIAALDLQEFLIDNQGEWLHDFGHDSQSQDWEKGKMFGVLVVKNSNNQLGYLATFSGKLAGSAHHPVFVPSLFKMDTEDDYLTKGMLGLTAMSNEIKSTTDKTQLVRLKKARKAKSIKLQQWLFDQYHFLNQQGETKSLCNIFEDHINKPPPSAAGECAAPKLFQFAFEHKLKPIAIAEFWWGKSSKSADKVHLNYYPACQERCRPILGYMLDNQTN